MSFFSSTFPSCPRRVAYTLRRSHMHIYILYMNKMLVKTQCEFPISLALNMYTCGVDYNIAR